MEASESFPVTISVTGMAVADGDPGFFEHIIRCHTNIPETQSSVERLRALQTVQVHAARAIENILTRFPGTSEPPAIQIRAQAGDGKTIRHDFAFAVEYDSKRGGHNVMWKRDQVLFRDFCVNPAAAVTRAKAILEQSTNEWILASPKE